MCYMGFIVHLSSRPVLGPENRDTGQKKGGTV